jgi:epoxyqueuosine reductase
VKAETVKRIVRECGFELAGVAPADPPADFARYESWVADGMAGEMRYLTDRRAEVRRDARNLLPSIRSVICVGKYYSAPSAQGDEPGRAIISRYACGPDYHDTMRADLDRLVARLQALESFDSKICVDTAPLLERSYARLAGLGWIGKNTCLINEPRGSWFFLGEILTSLQLEPDTPAPDRCGTCRRCIDACPTDAIVEQGYTLDARRCIAYINIELRGAIPEEHRAAMGARVFGCDICQDVCPWNSAPVAQASPVAQAILSPSIPLDELAHLTAEDFRERFGNTPVTRAKHSGFLRNVAVAMGNSGLAHFREPLEKLASNPDAVVAEHARWALQRLTD